MYIIIVIILVGSRIIKKGSYGILIIMLVFGVVSSVGLLVSMSEIMIMVVKKIKNVFICGRCIVFYINRMIMYVNGYGI